MSFDTISIIGLGYIGLPTAAVFASRKKKVIGVDVNQQAVDTINRGQIHIIEPDLDMVVHAAVSEGYCPERVLPGQVLRELVQNDRIIGGMTPKCSDAAARLYKTFVQGECVITNARTAEMCKLTENSFRDVNIAFANELSIICDKQGINVWELIKLANRHPRVNILQPGPGVGGHCIAVDPWFIVSAAPDEARLIRVAREVNDSKPEWVINKVKLAVADYLQANPTKTAKDVIIACLGLAFKPDIDDLRESPSIEIALELSKEYRGQLLVVEPNIKTLPRTLEEHLKLEDFKEAMARTQIAVLLVAHKEFLEQAASFWDGKLIVDSCGIIDKR
jgi:UDP-N-acetyl-D-mannosaminuronic acid dehydrogenase